MLATKVYEYGFKKYRTKKEVGLEIEMENNFKLGFGQMFDEIWRIEEDFSLKHNGHELVLKKPIMFDEVDFVLDSLKNRMKEVNLEIVPSIRAGIHVHLNVQDATIRQVLNMYCVYSVLETVLTRFCGEGRTGNLFCLRGRDAEWQAYQIERAVEEMDLLMIKTNDLRYSAMNLQPLFTYGSVEFRSFATTPNLKGLSEWVKMLKRIKDYGMNVKCPWQEFCSISTDGPRSWFEKVLGEEFAKTLDYDNLEFDIMKDMRVVQSLCYQLRNQP